MIALAALSMMMLAGCFSLKPAHDPTRFYVLSSARQPPAQESPNPVRQVAIGLGPIVKPAYLDNPWIIVRQNDFELTHSEFHQWGEPLDRGIQRALRDDLSNLLDTTDVTVMQQTRLTESRYRITVNFSSFELTRQGEAVLTATWRIANPAQDNFERTGRTEIRKPFPFDGADYTAGVSALSAALSELSGDLAKAIPK